MLLLAGTETPVRAQAQQCKLEKVRKSNRKTTDPKQDKERTCKQKKLKFIDDADSEEKCQKRARPDEACCCDDPSGGDGKDQKDEKKGGGEGGGSPQSGQGDKGSGQPSGTGEAGATSPTPDSTGSSSGSDAAQAGADGKGPGKAGGTIGFGFAGPAKAPANSDLATSAPARAGVPHPGEGASSPFPHSGSGGPAPALGGGGSGGGPGAAGSGGEPATPEPEAAASKGADASPFEVSLAGGKLGAPKGYKSGDESDAAVAESAKEAFKADIGEAKQAEGTQSADDPDSGETLFEQISSRLREVKRRGDI